MPAGMGDVALCTELGRFMLAPYGHLVTKVLHFKHTYKEYVGVDACAANLMRPAMYGAYHHITVMGKEDAPCDHKYDVTGALCENNDKFAVDRMLPGIISISTVGAPQPQAGALVFFLWERIKMNIMGQLALIFGLSLVGEGVAALLPVSFPSSVISMVLLMALLLTGVIKDKHIKTVSNFLVANMAFFFIPSFVGIVEHGTLLKSQALPLLVIVGLTTPVVYLVTGWTVQLLMLRRRKGERK